MRRSGGTNIFYLQRSMLGAAAVLLIAACQSTPGGSASNNCYEPIEAIKDAKATISACQSAVTNLDATLKQNLEAQFNLGRALLKDEQYTAAVAPLKAAFDSHPQRISSRLQYATALTRSGRHDDAIRLLTDGPITRQDEAYLELLFIRADAHIGRARSGDSDKAMRDLAAARERAAVMSGVDAAYGKRATARLQQVALGIGEREKTSNRLDGLQRARDAFEIALGADGNNVQALNGVGETTYKMAKYHGTDRQHDDLLRVAYDAFRKVDLKSNSLKSNANAAAALSALHSKTQTDWMQLIAHQNKVAQFEPDQVSRKLTLARTQADFGRYLQAQGKRPAGNAQLQSAVKTYSSVLKTSGGGYGQAHLELGKLYQSMGRTADAQKHFSQSGNQPLALLETGKIEYNRGDLPAATKSFGEVIRLTKGNPQSALRAEALYYFSRTASENPFGVGRRDVTIKSADDALAFDPGNTEYRQQACLARIKWGDVMSREAENLCRVGVRQTTPELKAIEGMFHLRRAHLQSAGNQKRSWESAYGAFTDGLAIAGSGSAWSGSASWRNRLNVGQALAHYCIGFSNIGREVINRNTAGTRDAENYFKTFGVGTCPSNGLVRTR